MTTQRPPTPDFVQIASGLRITEGPVALPDGALLCVEVLGGRLLRIDPSGAVSVAADTGGGPNGAAIGPGGSCYIANNGGLTEADLVHLRAGRPSGNDTTRGAIDRVDLPTGRVERLYAECAGRPLIAPNDLVFDRTGDFYFTDHGSLHYPEPQPGHVFRAAADGSRIDRFDYTFERPNGIGVAPDHSELYVAETSTGRLWSLSLGAGMADLHQPPRLVFADRELRMDSLAVQADGSVCVACPGNDVIVRVAPDGRGERIATPRGGPTNICFGGPDLRTAFVTFLSGAVYRTRWDAPGLRLFGP